MFWSQFAKSSTLAAAMVVAAVVASPAEATLAIQLQSGAALYSQTGPSPLVMIQPIGNFTTTVNTGTATSVPALDLSSVDISSSTGGTFVITLSADGFTSPVGP